jgi:hypothetical protein
MLDSFTEHGGATAQFVVQTGLDPHEEVSIPVSDLEHLKRCIRNAYRHHK